MGYLRNPHKTASEFTEDGWLKSGDIGYIDKVDIVVDTEIIHVMKIYFRSNTVLLVIFKLQACEIYTVPLCTGLLCYFIGWILIHNWKIKR